MWDPQREYLLDAFHLVTFDMRGHGRSPVSPETPTIHDFADDVVWIADALGVQRFAFCGLSIGGAIGQSLGARYSDRLSSLVLSATGMTIMTPPELRKRADRVLAEGMQYIADVSASRWFTEAFVNDNPEIVRRHMKHLREMNPQGYADACLALSTFDGHGSAGQISVPTLVISGDLDIATPFAKGRALADAIPGARFELMPEASHLCNVESPELFSKLVKEHILVAG
ncbi:3-oxoadipate enol-lactonase [Alcanivorax marinus]|nr:3-oxoadipate enol-lactonase [Alloalcanivorax marinus]